MESHRGDYSIEMMCRVLAVSTSGYYAWRNRPESAQARRREKFGELVESIYYGFKKRYWAIRITEELQEGGLSCSLNYIANLLKEKGLKARNGKGFKYFPAVESKTNVSENLLRRRFEAQAPNQKWVTDITYIKVNRTWLYLAVVLDLFSRKVVGWSLGTHMREELILEALDMALSNRMVKEGLLLHSDRGVQYRGNTYQEALEANGIVCSMSRKGNCWDNAVMESFFSRLKVELIYAENYQRIEEAKSGIFEYIEIFYNRKRRHSALGYKSPARYEQEFEQLGVSTICG
ncbi:MAG: IS3 family transposase [Gammaproteobacteria bacterium]|nr:IS3 family transposase [Gammaproteobacteria bacterium]